MASNLFFEAAEHIAGSGGDDSNHQCLLCLVIKWLLIKVWT